MEIYPRIFVGTMACGEAEFAACCDAIKKQQNVFIEHYVVHNQPEIAAHQELFGTWNDRRSNFDLFVKIDADTVLLRPDALEMLWKKFRADNSITAIQTGLLDYFTNAMISGLNAFSSKISFSLPEDPLFCDRMAEIGHQKVLKPADTIDLYPIAKHCLYPSPKQAFHFGYRRWAKGQVSVVEDCIKAWKLAPEKGRLWALIGVRAAYYDLVADASYENPEFLAIFDQANYEYHSLGFRADRIAREVHAMASGSKILRVKRLLRKATNLLPQ